VSAGVAGWDAGTPAARWSEIEVIRAQNMFLAYVPDAPRRNCFAWVRIPSRIQPSTITPEI
jgi:hypothetical protein